MFSPDPLQLARREVWPISPWLVLFHSVPNCDQYLGICQGVFYSTEESLSMFSIHLIADPDGLKENKPKNKAKIIHDCLVHARVTFLRTFQLFSKV